MFNARTTNYKGLLRNVLVNTLQVALDGTVLVKNVHVTLCICMLI